MRNHSGPGGAEVVIDMAGTHVGHRPSSPPRTGPNRCRHTDSCMGSSATGRTNDGLPITDGALLISAPGDVPDDRRVIREAVNTWNFTGGR